MKILFSAHDPGGTNMLIPIIESLQERNGVFLFVAFAGPAIGRLANIENKGVNIIKLPSTTFEDFPNEYDVDAFQVKSILQSINPDIVVTATSINSNLERFFIYYAQKLSIKDYVFIDSWAGEDIRFNSPKVQVVPSNIFVCDSQMAKSYEKYKAQGSKILTVGNPHLELLLKKIIPKRKQNSDQVVLFCCENIKHYFPAKPVNEFTIIEEILNRNLPDSKFKLLIRPHPMESKLPWQEFIEKMKSKIFHITLELDLNISIYDSIFTSNLVMGVSSMALIESALLGVPTFSYQLGIEENSDMLYIPFKDYNINILKSFSELDGVIRNMSNLNIPITHSNVRHINAVYNTLSELIGNG